MGEKDEEEQADIQDGVNMSLLVWKNV